MHDIVVSEVEAPFAMPDQKDKLNDKWSMPDPVFRSTEGRTVTASDPESDIPTETADRDFPTETALGVSQNIRPKTNRHLRHKNKRRKSYWERNAAGLIVLSVLLLGLLIYVAWLYRGKFL